ncbi:MAG: hypothetical protein R3F39_22900 [Myxococcota bacterium]
MRTALSLIAILIALLSGAGLGYVGYQTLTAQADQSDMADDLADMGLEPEDMPAVQPAPTPASAYGFMAGALDALLGLVLVVTRKRTLAAALFVLGGASSIAIALATGATTGTGFLGIVFAGLLILAGILVLGSRPVAKQA